MAVWPFNRKKQEDQALPEEVQEYYEAGKRQRTGMAWLLALATLLVTVVIALLLFFGGRWVYQKFSNNDEPQAPLTGQTDNQDQNTGADNSGAQTETPAEDQAANTPAANNQQGSSSANTTQSSPAPSPSSQTETPDTGPSDSEIPDTGPGPGGLQ